jgi:membrane-bound metal-dependent hydrolase YbcI (DUF457 family)
MMGRSHLLLGAAGYLGIAHFAPALVGGHLSAGQLTAGTLVAAGAAMLPDLDHPQGTVSRSLGPVTSSLSDVVSRAAGGHRKGTHTLWAWLAVTLATSMALTSTNGPWVALLIAFFCASLLLRVLTEADGIICALLAAIAGGLAIMAAPVGPWMVAAVGIGYGLHLLGDLVTTEGIPPFYPLGGNVAVPVIGSTDQWRERTAGSVSGLVAFYLFVSMVFIPTWNTQNAAADSQRPANTERVAVDRVASQELARVKAQLRRTQAKAQKRLQQKRKLAQQLKELR